MTTEKAIRELKPESRKYRKPLGGGLFIEVRPSGARRFVRTYRFAGKQRTDALGEFPEVRLKEAQERSAVIGRMLKDRIDPHADLDRVREIASREVAAKGPRESIPEERRFENVARRFIDKRMREGIAEATLDKLNWNLGGVACDHFRGRDIASIKPPEVLALVEAIQEDGKIEKAKDIHRKLGQVFDYAIGLGLVDINPARSIVRAIVRQKGGRHPGLTNPKDVGALMRAIRLYPDGSGQNTRAALLLSAYTFLRSTELRGARWPEIDFGEAVWEVPGERMKGGLPHLVPLSRQALSVLEPLRVTRDRDDPHQLVFPAPKKPGRHMSDATLNAALRRLGYDTRQEHCQHGFRTTFSTNMNEQGWNRDWIEAQLAHVERNDVRGAYNRALYLEGRREMMQAYADWLDAQAASVRRD